MRLAFISIFPDMILEALNYGIVGRAIENQLISVSTANPRDFAEDAHKSVDDKPFGGGPGMLMMAPLLGRAVNSLGEPKGSRAVILSDPTGNKFDQSAASSLANFDEAVFVCGRYEGIDERFAEKQATHRFSIGDFVLSGGELAALVMADAIVRLLPGALGDSESLAIDSHAAGLLGAPQYTRPESWEGLVVPDVLRSGDHGAIEKWKRRQALRTTRERRPDLFALSELEKGDVDMLSS